MRLTLLLFLLLGVNSESGCQKHCIDTDCLLLNGNLTHECGLCDYTAKCYPNAIGFDDWYPRRYANETLREIDRIASYHPEL